MDLRQTGKKAKKWNIRLWCWSKQKGRSKGFNTKARVYFWLKICVHSWQHMKL